MLTFLAPRLAEILGQASHQDLEEVRLRVNKPLVVKTSAGYHFLDKQGRRVPEKDAYVVSAGEIDSTIQLITKNSWYAWEEEIRRGYFTVPGGHRVGFCGRAVLADGKISTVRFISSLTIRLARSVPGCAEPLLGTVCRAGQQVLSTLIISPPGCGKTTLLRDLARCISEAGFQVVIIDERSEIAASYRGVPQLDVGPQTDVLDGYPKAAGAAVAVRALSPQVVVTDEIGHPDDGAALAELARCGVKVLATCHGESTADVKARRWVSDCIGVFQLAVILSRRRGPGTVERVLSLSRGT